MTDRPCPDAKATEIAERLAKYGEAATFTSPSWEDVDTLLDDRDLANRVIRGAPGGDARQVVPEERGHGARLVEPGRPGRQGVRGGQGRQGGATMKGFVDAHLSVLVAESPILAGESFWDYSVRRLAETGRKDARLTRLSVEVTKAEVTNLGSRVPEYVGIEEWLELEFAEPAKVDKEGPR
jgi:hypothetical protein